MNKMISVKGLIEKKREQKDTNDLAVSSYITFKSMFMSTVDDYYFLCI